MSDQSSPIREPEISREALIKLLADHFGFRPYEQMAEDKSDLRGKIRDGYDYDINEPTRSHLSETADAILNLAPVAKGAGAEPGAGWVYNSPDTGMEYSTEHPLESGEIPDATDVRRSTFFEDWMFGEIGRLDAKVRELVVNLAPVGGRGEEGSSRADLSPASRSLTRNPAGLVCDDCGETFGTLIEGLCGACDFDRLEGMIEDRDRG
jgi:hypothetical protein